MVAKIHPDNPDLSYGWNYGENNWNTGNDISLKMIGTLLGCQVASRQLTDPPISPTNGDRYIVAVGGTGDWLGQDNRVAVYIESVWEFYGPLAGLPITVVEESVVVRWSGVAYIADGFPAGAVGNLQLSLLTLLSINAVNVQGASNATITRATIATYIDRYNLRQSLAINELGFTGSGALIERDTTNDALFSNDLTNAAWVKTNATALLDQIGYDGAANTASSVTATAANGTAYQTVIKASAENTYSVALRRLVGTGDINITIDGGSTLFPVTLTTEYQTFSVTQTLANPEFGIEIVTSGDAVAVDQDQLEEQPYFTSYIATAGASDTRSAATLTVPVFNHVPASGAPFSVVIDFTAPSVAASSTGRYLYDSAALAERSYLAIDSAGDLVMRHGSVDVVLILAANLVDGQAYRAVMVFDGTNITGYINGVEITTSAAGTAFEPDTAGDIYIGSDNTGAAQFDGAIERVVLTHRAYSIDEARLA